jgi:hypothetical protein
MADDYSRIAEWEQRTGRTAARIRREVNFWEDMESAGTPF